MRLALLLAPLALSALFLPPALAQDLRTAPGTISIQGHGEASGTPDTASVTSGVTTQANTAREALDANTAAMEEIIETLREAGIEHRDIQTSNFSVSPNYVYTDRRDADGYQLPPRLAGYTVSNSVSVRVRQIDNLGAVLDRLVSVGSNTLHGISFSVDDPTALYEEARRRAFADALARAETYADAAGVRLGAIRQIVEGNIQMPPPQPFMERAVAMDMAASPVPVERGELTFAVNVSVTWDLGG